MNSNMDQKILRMEQDMMRFRLKKLDINGDLYEDDEVYPSPEVDENEEHRLCRNELI